MKIDYKKVCVVMPAYNEEQSIANVIQEIRGVSKKIKIVVVNDASGDKTALVARKMGTIVIDHPFNLGVGGTVQTGLIYARQAGFNIVIQVDADGQHNPKDISNLTNALSKCDLVIGSRHLKENSYESPLVRKVGSKLISSMINIIYNTKITDPTSGFRAFNIRAINFLATNILPESSDLLWSVLLLRNGFTINEIPTKMRIRKYGKSVFGLFFSIYTMITVSIVILLELIKEKNRNE